MLEVFGMFAISDGTQTSYLDVDQNQRATKNMGGSRELLFAVVVMGWLWDPVQMSLLRWLHVALEMGAGAHCARAGTKRRVERRGGPV